MLLTENLSSISPMIYIVRGKRQSLKQKVNVNINAYSEYEDLVPSEMLLSLMWITSMSNSPCPAPESYLETNDWQSAIQVGTKASIKYRPDHTIEIQIQYFVTRPQIPVSDFQIDHFAGSIDCCGHILYEEGEDELFFDALNPSLHSEDIIHFGQPDGNRYTNNICTVISSWS